MSPPPPYPFHLSFNFRCYFPVDLTKNHHLELSILAAEIVLGNSRGQMDNTCKMDRTEVPVNGIFWLPGEPAIVINGLPSIPLPPTGAAVSACNVSSDTKPLENTTGFGEWLVGREVVKPFGGQFYTGKVTEFDQEMGWYRVVYEDGDSEDLEWCELEGVLRPLDIMVPLKSIAAKMIRRQKSVEKYIKPGTRTMKQ